MWGFLYENLFLNDLTKKQDTILIEVYFLKKCLLSWVQKIQYICLGKKPSQLYFHGYWWWKQQYQKAEDINLNVEPFAGTSHNGFLQH